MIRLTPREKTLAVASAIFIAVCALLVFIVKPAVERIDTLARVIPEKQAQLKSFRAKVKEYTVLSNAIETSRTKILSQEKTFELLPFLESLIKQSNLTPNVATMDQRELKLEQYNETIVEIELQNLPLSQLINFLWQIDSSKALARTKSLYIKKSLQNPNTLDSTIEIHNLKLAD
jgi:type II secretory pathway component PulM